MSAGCFDNASCGLLSSYKMFEQLHSPKPTTTTTTTISSVVEKQGIVSILNNNNNNNIILPTYPIRRTLSADMSSQKWLQNNGLPHSSVKRVKSSVQLQALGEEDTPDHDHDDNKGPAFEEIWSSIQADKKSWGCILSAPKNDGSGSGSGSDSGELPLPYVHPLAKRTGSSLSEKSLEICTESLGSETGSDGYSYPASEPEDSEHEHEEEEEGQQQESEVRGYNVEVGIYKYNNNNRGPTSKRSMMVPSGRPSSFPPPLPSLAHRHDGSNLHIRSHRQDGRLVVEAVAVPSHNRFRAQRHDGRLLLTFSSHQDDDGADYDEIGVVENEDNETGVEKTDHEEEEEEEEEEVAIPRGVFNVQRSCTALAMTKFMKSTWPRNYNKTVIRTLNNNNDNDDEEEEDETERVYRSLPPRPAMTTATAAAVAMNAYEYYWRRQSCVRQSDNSAVAMLKPLVGGAQNNNNNNNIIICAPQQVGKDTERNDNKVLYAAHNTKGGASANSAGEKAEYLLPWMLRGCKEPKKPSLLLWEPYCIATT